MSAPQFAPVDDDTQDLLSLIADDPDYARFLRVCEYVAVLQGGRVTVNAVRAVVQRHGIDFDARRFSSFWNRATAKGGPMVNTDEWETCAPTKTGRNGGKPQRVRRWVG